MKFNELMQQYRELRARYEANAITAEQFEASANRLSMTDAQGRRWQIGVRSGKWYRYDGQQWVEDTPPPEAPPPPETAAPPRATPVHPTPPAQQAQTVQQAQTAQPTAPAAQPAPPPARQRTRSLFTCGLAALGLSVLGCLVILGVAWATGNLQFTPIASQPVAQVETTEPAATSSEPTGEPAPTQIPPTPTTRPPDPTVTPQPVIENQTTIWYPVSEVRFDEVYAWAEPGWEELPQLPEIAVFEKYKVLDAMRLRYQEAFIKANPIAYEEVLNLSDVEAEYFLALPNDYSGVSIVCRQQDYDNYYAYLLNQESWWILKSVQAQPVVLAEGNMPADVQDGGWGYFRFSCVGNTLTAWGTDGKVAEVRDEEFPTGSSGIFFFKSDSASEGEAYIFRERVISPRYDSSGFTGWVRDTGQSGPLYVTFTKTWIEHQPAGEPGISGPVMSFGLRFENRGDQAVTIDPEMVSLRWENEAIPAMAQAPQSLDDSFPLAFPLHLGSNEPPLEGDVFFEGITSADLVSGMQLVIDLTSLGLDAIRFDVPVE